MTLKDLEQRANNGDIQALMILIDGYHGGLYGLPKDDQKTLHWCEIGNAFEINDITRRLASCYAMGFGINQDLPKAMEYFKQAALRGDLIAMKCLASNYRHGGNGLKADYQLALTWYLKAAEAGDSEAMCEMGIAFTDGAMVTPDYEKAVCWFERSVDAGNINALCNLASCYFKGHGVKQNFSKAVELYRRGAERGDALAICNLAACYFYGYGVEIDKAYAQQLAEKSVLLGFEPARRFL